MFTTWFIVIGKRVHVPEVCYSSQADIEEAMSDLSRVKKLPAFEDLNPRWKQLPLENPSTVFPQPV